MGWFNTLKFHDRLRELLGNKNEVIIDLGPSESKVQEMWNASNPDQPYIMRNIKNERTKNYPVDNWYGAIINENGKARLVAISGFAVRQGKEGKQFAYKGGTWSVVRGYGGKTRQKALQNKPDVPTIAGYTAAGSKFNPRPRFTPSEHEVIPDEVIQHFEDNFSEGGYSWSISKWMQILKVDIDFDSDKNVDEGMMGYYGTPTPEGKKRYREILAEIQAEAKRDLGMEMPEELIEEVIGLKEPVEHIKIFHKNVYAQLKRELGREPTDKEITNRMTSTITHEAIHAAHDKADPKFLERPEEQKEYLAYMLQYPDSVIDAIEDLGTHSAIYEFKPNDIAGEYLVEQMGMPSELVQLMGFGKMKLKENMEPLRDLKLWAKEFSNGNKKVAEVLARVELVNKKANPSDWNFPINYEQAKKRYSELYKNDPTRRKNFEAWLKSVYQSYNDSYTQYY
tara:strand:- start:291 stop:1646 length:1356 start_codon:yes stop_codon:yes gene_type:complete